ncbi:acyl-CoA thioesterase [Pseudonocardia sp. TRM90224]|uniref:acyl-CoA thioesterase n=1 Tax=Pseudonocardia sp. TRM90224 TaxID=2812678 RepID=UPI001E3FDF0B|nr:thioesterase family protein [Pseudonocardia sp. TRM90224]
MDIVVLPVRADDLDVNGHVRGPAYLAYADHARWAGLVAAGVDVNGLLERGFGPVNLETTVRFAAEVRASDIVSVSTAMLWGEGKTSRVVQQLHRSDGVLAAEVSSVSGLMDLSTRRLVPRPGEHWRAHAAAPELLGL